MTKRLRLCGNCKYFEDDPTTRMCGHCHFQPPVRDSDTGCTWFPEVQSNEWCGQHDSRPREIT